MVQAMRSLENSDQGPRGASDPDPVSDPASDLDQLRAQERLRTGPGSAARRTLEALADKRRLNHELADFDEYDV
jgi:hypothetical protein